ncbi:MAG: GxxExxY protein [Chloroflexota bacterium]
MPPKDRLLYRDLTYKIIGAAITVHQELGQGFLEKVYESALAHEFNLQNIRFQQQANLTVYYKDAIVGDYRADFLVEDKVVVELKATQRLVPVDEAQLLNYLKVTRYRIGLLLNFGTSSLEHKRRVL